MEDVEVSATCPPIVQGEYEAPGAPGGASLPIVSWYPDQHATIDTDEEFSAQIADRPADTIRGQPFSGASQRK
jgi:hypothetical protein